LLQECLSDSTDAVEQELREALERAWAEYEQAESDEKAEARNRYQVALRRFADRVLR
jgi:vacuolar-type H+-ATPase subunit E/Vma4